MKLTLAAVAVLSLFFTSGPLWWAALAVGVYLLGEEVSRDASNA